MRVGIVGSKVWTRPEAAEEIINGFVSGLPKHVIILAITEDDGVGRWAKKYAQANRSRITEFTPVQVKGAKYGTYNYTHANRNMSESAEKIFCFLDDNGVMLDADAPLADLMTTIRLAHVPHVIYTFAEDETDETKLKLVSTQEVTAQDLLPKVEANGSGTGTNSSEQPAKKARAGRGDKHANARKRSGSSRTKRAASGKSRVATRLSRKRKDSSDSGSNNEPVRAVRNHGSKKARTSAKRNRKIVLIRKK